MPQPLVAPDPLKDELALLRQAQLFATEGRWERAQGLLAQHATQFPQGRLALDRDYLLASHACEEQGSPAARQAYGRFVANYPTAPQRERLRQLCLPLSVPSTPQAETQQP